MDRRIIFSYECEKVDAIRVLEDNGADFDFDTGDRMMISTEDLSVLDENDIDYDLVV